MPLCPVPGGQGLPQALLCLGLEVEGLPLVVMKIHVYMCNLDVPWPRPFAPTIQCLHMVEITVSASLSRISTAYVYWAGRLFLGLHSLKSCDVLVTYKSLTEYRSMSFRKSVVFVIPSNLSPPMVLMLSLDMNTWIAYSSWCLFQPCCLKFVLVFWAHLYTCSQVGKKCLLLAGCLLTPSVDPLGY